MNLNYEHAMVVLSGGQDSTTCLGWALNKYSRVSAVTFDYGQRHLIELTASRQVVRFFEDRVGVPIAHEVVALGDHVFAGTSPLTNPGETLDHYTDHDSMEKLVGDQVEKTFVPMRNAVFLMLAANRAIVAGAGILVTGVCQEDNANYPDCRADFIASAEATINEALGINGFVIDTPLMFRAKSETVKLALEIPHAYAALALSHTAYDGAYPPVGKDHASILRAHGFEEAGVPDPLVMRAVKEGAMCLPDTLNYSSIGAIDEWNANRFAVRWRQENGFN